MLRVVQRAALVFAMCFITAPAWSQAAYTLDTPSGPIEMVPQTREFDGVPYAAVGPFVEAAAGGQRIAGGTAQIDLRGATAWIDDGRTRTSGSRGNLTLNHPPYVREGTLWVAIADLTTLFEKAFDVRWTPVAVEIPEPESEMMESEPEELSPFDLDDDPLPSTPTEEARPTASRFTVVIDPGHGGADKGAVGAGGLSEADIVLQVAQALAGMGGDEAAFAATLTRSDDRQLSAAQRVRVVEESQAQLILSLHAGEGLTPTTAGYTVIYSSGAGPGDPRTAASRTAAETLADSLAKSTGRNVIGVRGMPLKVAQGADVPAVLLVIGALNNPAEERLLSEEEQIAQIVSGIAQGLSAHASARVR